MRSSFTRYFAKQARKPAGIFGRFFMARVFNKGNLRLNRFTEQQLALKGHEQILEIGFGTGFLIQALAGCLRHGCVHGVDFSDAMAGLARKRNLKYIRQGRVRLALGDFNDAAYSDNHFDTVLTVNTVYFWSDPHQTLEKIHRILKPGARLIIAFHDNIYLEKKAVDRTVFTCYSPQAVADLASDFFKTVDIRSEKRENPPCYCVVAVK